MSKAKKTKRSAAKTAVTVVAATTTLAALVAGGVRWAGRAARDNDLMARAIVAVPKSVWQPDGDPGEMSRWISDHEILRLEETGTGVYAPVVFDMADGNPLPKRTVAVAAPGLPIASVRPLNFSPNGRWLLCRDRSVGPGRFYSAVALDGSQRRIKWPGPAYGTGETWFPDSRRFITVLFDDSKRSYIARLFSIDAPGKSKPVRLPGLGSEGSYVVGALPSGRFLGRDIAIAYHWRSAGASYSATETLMDFGVGKGAARPRAHVVASPPVSGLGGSGGAFVRQKNRVACISPQGDRVLWVVGSLGVSDPPGAGSALGRRLYEFLERTLPIALRPAPRLHYHYELATARLDGRGGVTRLGGVTPPERRSPRGAPINFGYIADWQWTPDGKRISFTYDGALYTVFANAP